MKKSTLLTSIFAADALTLSSLGGTAEANKEGAYDFKLNDDEYVYHFASDREQWTWQYEANNSADMRV